MSLHNRKSLEPWIKDDVLYYEHQTTGIRQLAKMRNFILADDMGLGKSVQALTVFAIDIKLGICKKALIVCPATLRYNWLEEIEKFMGDVQVHMLSSSMSRAKRQEMINNFNDDDRPRVMITNYEMVVAHLEPINRLLFDVVILDEAHYIKNRNSKRTKAALRLVAKRFFLLTGSPMLNRVDELYPLLARVEAEGIGSYWRFVNRYGVWGGFGGKSIVGTKNAGELKEILSNYMLRRKKSEVLDLPAVQYVRRVADLHPEQRKHYNRIVSEMMIKLENGGQLDVQNALTKFLRLKQICGTTACIPGIDTDHSHKLDLAVEDAHELLSQGNKLVVFTQFRKVQERFIDRLLNYGDLKLRGDDAFRMRPNVYQLHGDVPSDERQAIVREWTNDPNPSVMVAMFQVAGVGLNMAAARHALFLDKLFVPAMNQQAVDRLHRIGQGTQPVQILEYFVHGTVEDRIEQILRIKTREFDNLVEGSAQMRKIVEAVVNEGMKV